jgi:hypothetical protein
MEPIRGRAPPANGRGCRPASLCSWPLSKAGGRSESDGNCGSVAARMQPAAACAAAHDSRAAQTAPRPRERRPDPRPFPRHKAIHVSAGLPLQLRSMGMEPATYARRCSLSAGYPLASAAKPTLPTPRGAAISGRKVFCGEAHPRRLLWGCCRQRPWSWRHEPRAQNSRTASAATGAASGNRYPSPCRHAAAETSAGIAGPRRAACLRAQRRQHGLAQHSLGLVCARLTVLPPPLSIYARPGSVGARRLLLANRTEDAVRIMLLVAACLR